MMMRKILLCFFMAVFATGCAPKPYVIVQVADAQLGFTAADSCIRAGVPIVNDLRYESECLRKAVEYINGISPDAVVFTGDQVNYPNEEVQWTTFNDIISALNPSIKALHLPGNHDVLLSEGNVDSTPFTDRYSDDHFVHKGRGVKLVGVNTNLIKHNDPRESEQMLWLENALDKADSADVTLVFGHHPFFMTGIDEPDSYFPIMQSKRYQYFELFKEKDVDAVYAGHRHESFDSQYDGVPMKTTTSVAYQIGKSKPSVRVITVFKGVVTDQLVEILP